MMRQIESLLIVLFCFAGMSSIQAQTIKKANLHGFVQDADATHLTSATVMLLNARDSVLTSFATTDGDGAFLLKNIPAKEYLLKISYLGFATKTLPVSVGEEADMDLGVIVMDPASEVLSEVEVTAEYVPIQMKEDTIEYNADAFQTQPNAVVEDLLKKLPGVEVGADGSIKAQGEDVQNVLVDGKEFFGTDPKMATKNLPAKAIKKVKVYDKMSDMAEFSGIDDGDREKTINLELREDFKTGLFGTAEAGYGSDDRYMAKANINKFTKKSQLSFLGLANNVNEQGFSFDEYVNFSGGMRAMGGRGGGGRSGGNGVPISQGVGNGLTDTYAGGLNYNFEVGERLDVRSSYFYNGINNDLVQSVFRQNFINGTTYITNEDDARESNNHTHRLNLRAEYDLDSTQNIELVSSASFGGGDQNQLQYQETFNPEMVLENTGLTNSLNQSDRMNYSGDLYYRKRLAKKGRVLSTDLSVDGRNDDGEIRLKSINEYLTTGNTDLLNQLQYSTADNFQWGAEIRYTEPIGRRQFVEFGYEFDDETETSVRDASDIDSVGNEFPNADLSTQFDRNLRIHRPGVTWRWTSERSNLSVSLEYQDTQLDGVVNDGEADVTQHSEHFLPAARWRYELGTARNLRVDYRTSVNVPSVYQLSPVVDNTDPLNIYLGNPNLKPEYAHRMSAHFHSFSQFSFTSVFARIQGTVTTNKIVNATTVDAQFVETTTPVNIDRDLQLGAYGSFGTPLRFARTRLQINANIQYNNSQIPINGVDNDLNRWTRTAGLSFQNQNSDVYEYNFGGDWTWSTTRYSEMEQRNQDYFTHHYFADATINFLKNWSLTSSIDYKLYTGDQFEENLSLPIWKASASRYIMGRKGQLKLSVFDILDENKGISRTSTANYIEEIRANSIGRYVMFSFLYSIRGFSKNTQGNSGGFRMFRH